jgi:predicted RNA binding protein YcfA (HicA-like mRNA interferase family)
VSDWPSAKARRVLAALLRTGWTIKRTRGSHRVLQRAGFPDLVFSFHDKDEIGSRMLAKIAKHADLRPEDL